MPDIKEEEREIELFLINYRDDLVPFLSFNESPDGRIHLDDSKVIGIEHTRIFQPKPDEKTIVQQQESIRNDIVETAYRKYQELTDLPHLNVVMGFEDYYWINMPSKTFKKTEIDSISDEIIQFINGNIPNEDESFDFHLFHGDTIPRGLLSLTIYRPGDGDHRKWRRHSGGVVPPVQANHIQDAINPKNRKVQRYRESCNELWLVLVINNIKYERSIIYEQNILHHEYETDFDKTFLFELDFDKHSVYELGQAVP